MTKIIISNCIKIVEPTKEIKEFCKKQLEFKNPDYIKKQRMNFYVGKTPKTIKLYDNFEGTLYIPTGSFEQLWKIHPYKDDYVDYTVSRSIEVKSSISLREYQEPCIKALKEHYNGILNLPCGTGKTISAIACVCELKERTLWIAGTIDLLNQAKETAETFTTLTTSMITEGKMDLSGQIVFSTPQSLLKFINNGEISQDEFGMVVNDECQHISTNPNSIQIYRTCFEYFAARIKCGLTATIWRSDGLQDCILRIVGEPIYKMIQSGDVYKCVYNDETVLTVPIDKFQVPCKVKVIETNYNLEGKEVFAKNGGTIQFASLINDIAMDVDRNDIIIQDLINIEGSTIILSDRVEQLKYLCSKVENGVEIDGSTPKKLRVKALEDVRSGKVKYLFSSFALAKEGLNCPVLSNLILATPVKGDTAVIQSCGRIQRPFEGKTIATVYDYVDKVGMLRNFYAKRRSIYRKNKWAIENIYLGG